MSKKDFEPEVCDCCNQRTEYLLTLSKGIATIVKAVGAAIKNKVENVIHPAKEMQIQAEDWTYQKAYRDGKITSSHRGNFSNARIHGLLAKYENESGAGSHLKHYWNAQDESVTIHDLTGDDMPRWEPVGFEIQEGSIVEKPNYSQGPTRAGKNAGDGKTTNMF